MEALTKKIQVEVSYIHALLYNSLWKLEALN